MVFGVKSERYKDMQRQWSLSTNDTWHNTREVLGEKKSDISENCFQQNNRRSKGTFCLRSPPPSQQLKKILSNYPESPQIFQEAIQNADDAEASLIQILLDERNLCDHLTEEQVPQSMKRFLGPSIIFFNNSIFQESDWSALQNMFESSKMNHPEKIGRFGMGSRSYFHLADVLIILSGNQIAYLDPDWILTEDGGDAEDLSVICNTQFRETSLSQKEIDSVCILRTFLSTFHDIFMYKPNSTFYNGTLIRLPLRQGKWARTSTFAPYEYTVEKAKKLIDKFMEEASHCLLFLQNIHTIQIWRWSTVMDIPFQTFACNIRSGNSNAVVKKKMKPAKAAIQSFFQQQKEKGHDLKSCLSQADTGHLPEIEDIFQIQELKYSEQMAFENEAVDVSITTQLWLLSIHLVSNSDLVSLLNYSNCPPIVGIAVPTGPSVTQKKKRSLETMKSVKCLEMCEAFSKQCIDALDLALLAIQQNLHTLDSHIYKGLAFTYLPLPDVTTGLPVHIHGTFQLTDNRRCIWMTVNETEGKVQKWSQWNATLLFSSIPQLYGHILVRFAKHTCTLLDKIEEAKQRGSVKENIAEELCRYSIDNYYAVWPDPAMVPVAFQPLLHTLVTCIKDQKVVIREPQSLLKVSKRLAAGTKIASNVTSCIFQRDIKNLSPLKPSQCMFLQLTDIESSVFETQQACLYEAVAQCQLLGHPIVLVPETVKQMIVHFRDVHEKNGRKKDTRLGIKIRNDSLRPDSENDGAENLVAFLDIWRRVLLPHWVSLASEELLQVPYFETLMLCVCQILGRGPNKVILEFQQVCSSLVFVPLQLPGVVCDDEEHTIFRSPCECFDPSIHHFNIASMSQPAKEFRSPDVIRVLRCWGMKRSLRWDEMAQEAVTRVCVIPGCRENLALCDSNSKC